MQESYREPGMVETGTSSGCRKITPELQAEMVLARVRNRT